MWGPTCAQACRDKNDTVPAARINYDHLVFKSAVGRCYQGSELENTVLSQAMAKNSIDFATSP